MEIDMVLTKADIKDTYFTSIRRFKALVNKLPDDGQIIIEVEKDYGDKTRIDWSPIDCFALKGNVFTIGCTTKVDT